MSFDKTKRRKKIKMGIRKRLSGTPDRPRLTIFKSNKAIYAQVIDDTTGNTLFAIDSAKAGIKGNVDVEASKKVGAMLAELAKEKGCKTVVFDRNGYKYHGQVKALAEGAREGGLKF